MNMMGFLKNYMAKGLTPENIVTKFAGNNPMIQNLIQMQKKGDTKGVENFARNFCKEKGIDFDKEYSNLKSMFK